MQKILILGANGFIGSHLVEAILAHKDWEIFAIDLQQDKLQLCLQNSRFHFFQADMTKETKWVDDHVKCCDIIIPLVAIATPAIYVKDPLRVFSLDFEANLAIVKKCVAEKKRLIFPSTSEVYGMCSDNEFDEESSLLVTGPTHKERWIYSTSKQLLDRLIYAYGKHHGLNYTLFRPFNWYGPRLDNVLDPKPGSSRVLTQFIGNILRKENILLVNGGAQQRCFTYIDDGIDALLRIIENKNNAAVNKIFNLGNPSENISIKQLAQSLIHTTIEHFPHFATHVQAIKLLSIPAEHYYGEGYQDVSLRVPSIKRANKFLNWHAHISIQQGLHKTLEFYFKT